MSHGNLPAFQQYQLAFTAFIRDPAQHKAPKGASRSGMAVYKEIVYNNLESSVAACFPVCKQVLGKRAWAKLVRRFMREHASGTPIFREIPAEFLTFINTQSDVLPIYIPSLAHYEWVELAIATLDIEVPTALPPPQDWLLATPIVNPTLQVLAYDYPVQYISPKIKPQATLASPVHLLVFRDDKHQVHFMEINAVTARFIALLKNASHTTREVLQALAVELQHPDVEAIKVFGLGLMHDFYQQQVILGAHPLSVHPSH